MGKKRKRIHYHAAGGVVIDDAGHALLLERTVIRQGHPTHETRLPKGHIEPGETPEQAALREVCEESGYCQLEILADLGKNSVSFEFKKKQVERDEHYYLMRLTSPQRLAQKPTNKHSEETLFAPRWADSLVEAEALLTFDSEKEFVRRAQNWLKQRR
jgi:8-oxo-dGTP pyrophosphatase MutT (NUDIX family)